MTEAKWRVANSSRPGRWNLYFLARETTQPAFTTRRDLSDSERGRESEYRRNSRGVIITYRTFEKAQAAADRLNAANVEGE